MVDTLPFCRFYWIATMPDGTAIPQYNSDGVKFQWKNLPDKPTTITLSPFTEELAVKVRAASKVAALPIPHPPVEVADCGGGLLAGIDERMLTKPIVKCQTCGHTWPFNPKGKAECPVCHDHDEFFCAECQENKTPLVVDNKAICPDCKLQGKTRGLKRIMKFQISVGTTSYDFQHWVRTGGIELRWVTEKGRFVIRPYSPPPKIDTPPQQ